MASLEELSEQLDQIDDKIAELYEERMEVCARLGRSKSCPEASRRPRNGLPGIPIPIFCFWTFSLPTAPRSSCSRR